MTKGISATSDKAKSDKTPDSVPIKFTKYKFCFEITKAKIDAHFASLEEKSIDACKVHIKLLISVYTLAVYITYRCLPESSLCSASESRLDLSKISESPKILDISEKSDMRSKNDLQRHRKALLDHYHSLEAEIIDSERKICINSFVHPDKQFLDWFNWQYSLNENHWANLGELRQYFAKYQREELISYFLAQTGKYRSNVYDPQLEAIARTSRDHLRNQETSFVKEIKKQIPGWQAPTSNLYDGW